MDTDKNHRAGKRVIPAVIIGVIGIILIAAFIFAAGSLKREEPDNPLESAADSSLMGPVSEGENSNMLSIQMGNSEEGGSQKETAENPEENKKNEADDSETKNGQTEESSGDEAEVVSRKETKEEPTGPVIRPVRASDSQESNGGISDGSNLSDRANSADTGEEEGQPSKPDYDGYFTTTIKDGETVADSIYRFQIKQKNHQLKVLDVSVLLNEKKAENFQGAVELGEGKNTIIVQVKYQDRYGKEFKAERTYTVYLVKNHVIITTDLADTQTVEDSALSFRVSACLGDEVLTPVVMLNGNEIDDDSGKYTAALNEGENIVRITAAKGGNSAEKSCRIIYRKPETEIRIMTDLADGEVTEAVLSFWAYAESDGVRTELSVMVNDERIYGNENYKVSLKPGINSITLSVGELSKLYSIRYTPVIDDGQGEEEITDRTPVLIASIQNTTVNAETFTFTTRPTDYKGNRIRADGVSVVCNGELVPHVFDSTVKTTYTLNLVYGMNQVFIDVSDTEGNTLHKEYQINCTYADPNAVIGTATVSVEAGTLGLGYIIAPVQVEIHPNQNAAQIIIELLTSNGIGYTNTGTLNSGFYLSGIQKSGIATGVTIPHDLYDYLEAYGLVPDMTNSDPDSLSEKQYTYQSGWMYSVNGVYPGTGMSEYTLADGDVVRIRYTLAVGRDVMGGFDENWGDW